MTSLDASSLLLLLNWMSPSFPIGSFAFSHGLETAIADQRIASAKTLEEWLTLLLAVGSGWNDALLFAQCWEREENELNELALALCGSAERYDETRQLGHNFLIAASLWTGAPPRPDDTAYPIAAGTACRFMGIPREQALLAFLQGFCSALVSVAVRLVPLGQTQGLAVLKNMGPTISATAVHAAKARIDDLGSICLAAEIAAMAHETLSCRIFRT